MPRRLGYSVTDDLDNGYARAMVNVVEQAESFSVGLSTSYGYSAEGYCDFADYVAVLGEVYGRLSDVNGVDKGSSIFSRYKSFSDILKRAAERENVLFLKAKAALSISGALSRARDDSDPNDWSRFYGDDDDSLDLDDWVDEFDGEEEPKEVEEGSEDDEDAGGLSPDALNMLDLLKGAGIQSLEDSGGEEESEGDWVEEEESEDWDEESEEGESEEEDWGEESEEEESWDEEESEEDSGWGDEEESEESEEEDWSDEEEEESEEEDWSDEEDEEESEEEDWSDEEEEESEEEDWSGEEEESEE